MTTFPLLFVLGGHKTGTSTINGLLNTSSRAFVLYETDLAASTITKYGHRLIDAVPTVRSSMGVHDHWTRPYRALGALLADAGGRYDVVGDKVVTLDPARLVVPDDVRVIVTGRDVATWCGKRQIIETYRTDLDLVPAARDLLRFWVCAGRCPHTLRVRLEDLVADLETTIARLRAFTGLADLASRPEWWTDVGTWCDDAVKQCVLRWPDVHPSSRRAPVALDTVATPNDHPFWSAVAPIRDDAIDADEALERIEALVRFSPLPLHAAYDHLESTSAIRELAPVRVGD